jgi:uncharacterized protein (DUF1330 family)|tara:strand:+ start:12252 stop:13118 length:867 start_codon:yes stop_codon:yes gene_type:complete
MEDFMKYLKWLVVSGISMLTQLAYAQEDALIDQNDKVNKAYIILQAEIVDVDMFFNQYAVPAEVEVDFYGGKPLVATFDKEVFEGEWDNNWTIILTFPSLDAAKEWYYSDNYQAVLPYRHAATAFGNMVFFEGTDQSKINWNIRQYKNAEVDLVEPLTLDTEPDYLIAIDAGWTSKRGRFQLEAAFDSVDVTGHTMALSYRIITDESFAAQSCHYPLVVSVGDTSGDLKRLGVYSDAERDWTNLEFTLKGKHISPLLESTSRVIFDLSSPRGGDCGDTRLEVKNLVIR